MWLIILLVVASLLLLVFLYDIFQTKDPILRVYPIVGHFRHVLSSFGPELRQYIVAANNEERPFSRDQRRWVYNSAAKGNTYFGFGTDLNIEEPTNHLVIKQSAFPLDEPRDNPDYLIPCKKTLGGWRNRKKPFTPDSTVFISGMSYGSLGKTAVEAMNRGCQIASAAHNTGEGGVSPHHGHGADLIWQVGTGYYGCRNEDGTFSLDRLVAVCEEYNVRAIEVKLSQGAKPGLGGVLPGKKVTPTIAKIRGIPIGKSCISPSHHTAFSNHDEMLAFIESIADATGLPVGIKSAVGDTPFWEELAKKMSEQKIGPDFIAVDGGEGGTGAAPLPFSDHVSLPFKVGFPRVVEAFRKHDMDKNVVFMGSGKLGFPQDALLAMALGCDMIGVAREPMLAIGCIQAQHCHTGKCPAGIATHSAWRVRGLDPSEKSVKCANYLINLRKEILRLSAACGHAHPAEVPIERFEILDRQYKSTPASEVFFS